MAAVPIDPPNTAPIESTFRYRIPTEQASMLILRISIFSNPVTDRHVSSENAEDSHAATVLLRNVLLTRPRHAGEWGGPSKRPGGTKPLANLKKENMIWRDKGPKISGPQGQLGGVARGPDRGPDRPTVSVGILGRGTSVGI